jgi:response regulator NasT
MNQAAARGTAKPNILVVDDDRAILSAMGRGLREAGYAVREAATGIEALRFCTELAPDLAMLDIHMPSMSGLEVAEELVQQNIPFIFLSSHSDQAVVRKAVEQGAYSYLLKPQAVPQIVPVIEAALVRAAEFRQLKCHEENLNFALAKGRAISVAIGMLMERYRLSADEAFNVLRQYARSARRRVDEVAADLVKTAEETNLALKVVGVAPKKIADSFVPDP